MAWDFTLHVLDRASLARFSARFLRGMHRDTAFDREYDADAMIAHVKQLIASDPATGARALGELALLYASTETPHAYSRGFALSLWDPAVMGVPLPKKWLTSVEAYLVDIVAARHLIWVIASVAALGALASLGLQPLDRPKPPATAVLGASACVHQASDTIC